MKLSSTIHVLMGLLLIFGGSCSLGHAAEQETPATTDQAATDAATADAAGMADSAADKPTAPAATQPPAEKTKQTSLQDDINSWFGANIVGPIWTYFLGAPVFQTETKLVFSGSEEDAKKVTTALHGDANIVHWAGTLKDKSTHTIHVAAADAETVGGILTGLGLTAITDGESAKHGGIPFIIIVLVIGAIFFTLRFVFVNIRLFGHAINCIRGKFDNPEDDGEISHFKALTSALSATVGLGNIAGVAVAICAGGAGAVFWMWLVAFCGMSMKFSSCTLSQMYRRIKDDGSVLGGPMVYLEDGLKEITPALHLIGKALAILFAVLCIMASFGGGNMFQGNQTYAAIAGEIWGSSAEAPTYAPWLVGIILAVLVGLVIIGGIKRIGSVTSKMVPAMCIVYCAVCLIIVVNNMGSVPALIMSIFTEAFTAQAAFGGFLGVLIQGMKRAAFSNEAGLGSAAIAHAAAKTKEPVREGTVAMLGPFIDTIVVCTMTALAILITGAHTQGLEPGVEVTKAAFASLHDGLTPVLTVSVIIFAYSTMISWSYYGERATEYLIGQQGILPYRIVYTTFVILGPVLSISNILDFSDLMLLSMAFPNIIGMIILSGKVKKLLDDYRNRMKSGEIKEIH